MTRETSEDKMYVVGDARDELASLPPSSARLVHLDDAWARPRRCGGMGVEYPTHDVSVSFDIVDACWRVLEEGGWLIADADDWFELKLKNYLVETYGNVAESYEGGGWRRTGGVTYLKSDGSVDRGGAGMYLRNGGYPVVFAHKGETDHVYESARQVAHRPEDDYDWHSVKPLAPYERWVRALCDPDDHVVVPCAGTAPAAVATERAFGEDATYTCIDIEPGARQAFQRRRAATIGEVRGTTLAEGWS